MALTPDQLNEITALLKEQARQQQQINSGLDGYLKALNEAKVIQETINVNREKEAKILANARTLTGRDREIELAKLQILRKQTRQLVEQGKVLKESLKDADKLKMTFAAIAASTLKGFNKLPNLIEGSFGKLKSFGLFEMDKAIRMSATEMGKFGKNTDALRTSIKDTATTTNSWGMGVKELSKLQSSFSEELGRTAMMGNEGLEAVSALAAATSLGVEGAGKLTAEMDNQGLSAKRTADFMEQTMNDSAKMGINASKVVKNIQNNMKMLNKYNFKGGVKGLAKMAQTTSKLGVDMNFVAGMADKLFDIEGAVDMSAQLQVMGGEWAELADPFKLMYMARNDMEGLTEAIGQAAASSAHFNKESGEFEISSLEMHRLRKIAEQTGVSYEELATAGKNAAKFSRIKTQMSFSVGGGEEGKKMQEFLENTAQLDESGKAFIIDMKGDKKYLNALGSSGKELIKAEMANQATLKERAEAAQTFDEKITNLINMVKTYMLPIVEGIDGVLRPIIDDLFKDGSNFRKDLKELGGDLGEFAKGAAGIAKWIGHLALELGPKGILYTFLAGKFLSFVADKAIWFTNGLTLAKGFATGSAGGMTGNAMGGMLNLTKGSLLKGGLLGLGGAAVGMGTNYLVENQRKKGNDSSADAINVGGSAASGALTGAAIGSLVPVIGTAIGAIAGGLIGAGMGVYQNSNRGSHDALFGSPIHDGLISKVGKGLGNDFSKNRGIVQGGKIHPIDNKDDLLAMKPGGGIMDGLINAGKDILGIGTKKFQINFGEIHFKFDDLVVKTSGGDSKNIGKELLNTPGFTRDITRMIHVETEKAINGGKLRG
jgi:uncharacterized protein YdbL (DUF1318 family)